MRVAVLFSGGKDSTYTVWLLQHVGWEVVALLTVRPSVPDSMLFHFPGINWTSMQAQALGISHFVVEAERDELTDFEDALVRLRDEQAINGLATGAVASDYQKSRFDQVCDSAGLKSYSPLWHKNPKMILNDLVSAGFRTIMTGVAAMGLDQSWLGREMTEPVWSELAELSQRHGIHLSGEGGEYETFVVDAPMFGAEIAIEESSKTWSGQSGHLVIEKASLRDKPGKRTLNADRYLFRV